MQKLVLGEYEWISYKEVKKDALNFGRGIRFSLGQEPGTLITIFAETRSEWMISCIGAFSQVRNVQFFTVYSIYKDQQSPNYKVL